MFLLGLSLSKNLLCHTFATNQSYCGIIIRLKSIISYFNDGGVIEAGVFTTEHIAEWIADELCIANHQVGAMMGMSVNPCGDMAVGDVVAEFSCIGCVQRTSFVSIFNSCENGQMVGNYNYLFSITFPYGFFDKRKVSLKLIIDVLGNEPMLVIENLSVVVPFWIASSSIGGILDHKVVRIKSTLSIRTTLL